MTGAHEQPAEPSAPERVGHHANATRVDFAVGLGVDFGVDFGACRPCVQTFGADIRQGSRCYRAADR